MNPIKLGALAAAGLLGLILLMGSFYVIDPGERGIVVTLGKVPASASSEGLGFKTPLVSSVVRVSIRQQTEGLVAQLVRAIGSLASGSRVQVPPCRLVLGIVDHFCQQRNHLSMLVSKL